MLKPRGGNVRPLLPSLMGTQLTPPRPRVNNPNQNQEKFLQRNVSTLAKESNIKLSTSAVFENVDINVSEEVEVFRPLAKITEDIPTSQKLVFELHPEEKISEEMQASQILVFELHPEEKLRENI
eukprot:GFUD01066702.1.p1 GENE.GFUD01066702.1~~GFUD01066702.1.p1  ORF type:complete len:144 (+),score=40.92 GFUD01066702.1:59-433(+)